MQKNPKKFCCIVKSFTDFIDPGTNEVINCIDTPDFFNAYFVNIIDRLEITDPDNTFHDFENLYAVNDELCFLNDLPTPDELILYVENIDLSKSSGVKDVNIKQCKDVLTGIPDIICCIYVTLLQTGIFPSIWSKGLVWFIQKQGNLSDPGNWRPITQTSVFSKLFKKNIYRRLYDHLDNHGIFSKFQYGFLPKRSTQPATFDLAKHVFSSLNNKKCDPAPPNEA